MSLLENNPRVQTRDGLRSLGERNQAHHFLYWEKNAKHLNVCAVFPQVDTAWLLHRRRSMLVFTGGGETVTVSALSPSVTEGRRSAVPTSVPRCRTVYTGKVKTHDHITVS